MKNKVRKISQKALEGLWNFPSNEPYLNNFDQTETKLACEEDGRNFRFLQVFIQEL